MGKKPSEVPFAEGKALLADPRAGDAAHVVKTVMSVFVNPLRVSLKIVGKKEPLVIEPPFRVAENTNQLRIIKESQMTLILIPQNTPNINEWARLLDKALRDSGSIVPPPRNPQHVYIVCPNGTTQDVELSTGPAGTVQSVMDTVVNRILCDIPTRFWLCYANTGKHCDEWRVTDGSLADENPAPLFSFGGELLYLVKRRIDTVTAFNEWMADWGAPHSNAYGILSKWSWDVPQVDQSLVSLAAQLYRVNERSIAELYRTIENPPPLVLAPHRLHDFGQAVEIPVHCGAQRSIRVTNNLPKPVLIRVQHSVLTSRDDGFQLHCHPRVVLCPEGQSRNIALDFTVTNQPRIKFGQIYFISITYTVVRKADDKPTGKELPWIVPFRVFPKNIGIGPPVAQDDRSLLNVSVGKALSVVDGSFVDLVGNFARKCIVPRKKTSEDVIVALRREIDALDSMRHPNLSRIEKYAGDGSKVFLFIPRVQHERTLREFLCVDAHISHALRIKIASDAATGLKHLHHFGYFIPDLRPESISIVSTTFDSLRIDGSTYTVNAKISDLGFISGFSPLTCIKDRPSDSIAYMAPEGGQPNERTVSYSFGMVLYAIITRVIPFSDTRAQWVTMEALTNAVRDPKEPLRPTLSLVPRDWSRTVVELMQRCWSAFPSSRPTDDEIIDQLQSSLHPIIMSSEEWRTIKFDRMVQKIEEASQRQPSRSHAQSMPPAFDKAAQPLVPPQPFCGAPQVAQIQVPSPQHSPQTHGFTVIQPQEDSSQLSGPRPMFVMPAAYSPTTPVASPPTVAAASTMREHRQKSDSRQNFNSMRPIRVNYSPPGDQQAAPLWAAPSPPSPAALPQMQVPALPSAAPPQFPSPFAQNAVQYQAPPLPVAVGVVNYRLPLTPLDNSSAAFSSSASQTASQPDQSSSIEQPYVSADPSADPSAEPSVDPSEDPSAQQPSPPEQPAIWPDIDNIQPKIIDGF